MKNSELYIRLLHTCIDSSKHQRSHCRGLAQARYERCSERHAYIEMIVQDEDSNWSYRSSSRLELIPSSQIQKIQKPLTASSAVTSRSTTAQHSRATKADKKLRTILVIDSSVMSGALGDDIQTVFNNYLFGDHSEQNNNAASAESQPYEFCMVNSLSVPVFRWTKYNLHLLPEDRMFDYTTIPEYEPVVLVVLESDVFLDLLCASTDGVYFPQLSDYMRRLFGDSVDSTDSMDVCEDDDVRVSNIVVLIDLDKCILKAQRKLNKTSNGSQRSVSDLVDSAVSYLIFEHNIELFRCKKSSEFVEYLHTLTRLIDSRVVQVVTEIDFVAKAQREKLPEGLSLKEQEAFDIRQTWSSMLQMLPLMSRDKALALIASSPDCSCPRSLFEFYCNSSSGGSAAAVGPDNAGSCAGSSAPLTAQQKMLLLQNSFGAGKNGAPKNQAKLSKLVYHMITATEPEGLINKFT